MPDFDNVTDVLDLAIIGAGISGVIHLHCAREAGLSAVLLERQSGIGGLWRQLPSWQDIQISPVDWALGDLPLRGGTQPHVLTNIQSWVDEFDLAAGIRTSSPVLRASHTGNHWALATPQGIVRARHLVAATGGHNLPIVPDVPRLGSGLLERHSGAFHDPSELVGRTVMVVGGGASAFDLLDLCLAQNARSIVWVYRSVRWFIPTGKPKLVAGSVRPFAKMQASGASAAQQSAAIGADLVKRYANFGIQTIQPDRPIDVLHDQLMPGRARMLAEFSQLERHPGSVAAIDGRLVTLSDGTTHDVDVLLWGTGYAIDLRYFAQPELAAVQSVNELSGRCGCIFRSLDAPDLYFPGVGLDGIGSATWANLLMARSIMSHIRGTAKLDMVVLGHKVNHFEIARHLSERDPGTYGFGRDWSFYRQLALTTPDDQPYPIV